MRPSQLSLSLCPTYPPPRSGVGGHKMGRRAKIRMEAHVQSHGGGGSGHGSPKQNFPRDPTWLLSSLKVKTINYI